MDVSYTHFCQKDEINWNWNAAQLSQSTWLQESPTDPHAVTIHMTTGITYWPTHCHSSDDYWNQQLTHTLSQFRWL